MYVGWFNAPLVRIEELPKLCYIRSENAVYKGRNGCKTYVCQLTDGWCSSRSGAKSVVSRCRHSGKQSPGIQVVFGSEAKRGSTSYRSVDTTKAYMRL